MKKILLTGALGALLLLGGCVAVPYDGYGNGYGYNGEYTPYGSVDGAYVGAAPLYAAPSVSLGFGYSNYGYSPYRWGNGWRGGRGGGWGHGGGWGRGGRGGGGRGGGGGGGHWGGGH